MEADANDAEDTALRLCQTCHGLSISAEDFLVRSDDESDRYEQEHELGTLEELTLRSQSCPLCWLVLNAAGNPSVAGNEDVQCFLGWQEDGFISGYDGPFARCLRVRLSRWPETFLEFNKISCLSIDVDGDDNLFLGRERPTERLNAKLIRKWVKSCLRWHGEDCKAKFTVDVNQLRVIDCWRLCIAQKPSSAEYVTLSYVWGQAKVFKLTQANKLRLAREGGLKRVWHALPRTIRDAIKVTSALNERYLWVDSLCIVQDDSDEKHELIPMMDRIYNQALLTIVAGGGKDANAGLCGVDKTPRSAHQVLREISPGLRLLSQKNLTDALDTSFWETRGWTYQERCLSCRCLYFFDDQVIFQCRGAVWREDSILEDQDVAACLDMSRKHSVGTKASMEEAHSDYVGSVYWYTRRNLSSGADALNAFTGISQILQKRMTEGSGMQVISVYGLPSHMLDWAMLWISEGVSHRRYSGWPSWSWCGWVGGASNSLSSLNWDQLLTWSKEHTWIEWKMFTESGRLTHCQPKVTATKNRRNRPPPAPSRMSESPSPTQVVDIEAAYLAAHSTPPTLTYVALDHQDGPEKLLPLLHFSTFIVHMHLQPMENFTSKPDSKIDRSYRILSAGTHVGSIWINPDWQHERTEAYEMLLLSDARLKNIHEKARPDIQADEEEWDAFHVMLVEQVPGMDVRERVAIGILSQSAFDPATAPVSTWQEVWLR